MRVIACGLGSFGKSWAQIVRDGAETELVAVVEPGTENRAWAISDELGMPESLVFPTIEGRWPALRPTRCLWSLRRRRISPSLPPRSEPGRMFWLKNR